MPIANHQDMQSHFIYRYSCVLVSTNLAAVTWLATVGRSHGDHGSIFLSGSALAGSSSIAEWNKSACLSTQEKTLSVKKMLTLQRQTISGVFLLPPRRHERRKVLHGKEWPKVGLLWIGHVLLLVVATDGKAPTWRRKDKRDQFQSWIWQQSYNNERLKTIFSK